MSEQREVEITIGSPEFNKLPKAERKARLARVLSRSTGLDHLNVELPAGVYGEWVHNDPVSIHSKRLLGFEIDTTYARQNALHSGEEGPVRVADVIFMTCPQEVYDLKREIDAENYEKFHGKNVGGNIKSQAEEVNFTGKQSEVGLPLIQESITSNVNADQLQAALNSGG
jgi:hypothetical protein